MSKEFFVIVTEDGVDQIVESLEVKKREVRDLKNMGCTVKALGPYATAAEAQEIADKIDDAHYS